MSEPDCRQQYSNKNTDCVEERVCVSRTKIDILLLPQDQGSGLRGWGGWTGAGKCFMSMEVLIKIEIKGCVLLTLRDSIWSVGLLSGLASTPLTSWITWAHKHVTHTWILHTHTLNILYAALNTIIKVLVLVEMRQKNICFQICLHFFELLIFSGWITQVK